MSDCSGIKTYMMPEEFEVSKYIDLTEKSEEERILEFIRTIELAVDSLERKKYSVEIFTDIINVVCNSVSDIFVDELHECGDCVITSPYAVMSDEESYLNFANDVKMDLKKYKEGIITLKVFYHYVKQGCDSLIPPKKSKNKQKIKF